MLAGAITLFVGWRGVSETAYNAKQLPYMAGCGLGGLFLLGMAAMFWLSADLHDEWRKLDLIEAAIREQGSAGLSYARESGNPAANTPVPDVSGRESEVARTTVVAGRTS